MARAVFEMDVPHLAAKTHQHIHRVHAAVCYMAYIGSKTDICFVKHLE